jgi:hypothetical protein
MHTILSVYITYNFNSLEYKVGDLHLSKFLTIS